MVLVRQNLNFRALQKEFLVYMLGSHLRGLGSNILGVNQKLEIDQPSQRQNLKLETFQFLIGSGDLSLIYLPIRRK